MLIKRLKRQTTRVVCSATMRYPGGKDGQNIRQKLIPHHYQPQVQQCQYDRLHALGGAYENKRCLIIGGAPSLRELDISTISVNYTFLLNRAYLLTNRPLIDDEAIVIANPFAFEEYGHEALDFKLHAAFLSGAIDIGYYCSDTRVITYSQWENPRIYEGFFQLDLQKPLYHGTSVAFNAIQIAVWMGFDEIILAGIDFRFDSKDAHFYDSSAQELQRTDSVSLKNSVNMVNSLRYCCEILKNTGKAKIVSVSPYRDFDFLDYRTPEELAKIDGKARR